MDECLTNGVIVAVKRCWWLKINTKPVRAHALDGAVFPYVVTVRYSAGGSEFVGKKTVVWKNGIPRAGQEVTVWYNANKPAKIIKLFPGSSVK